MKLGKQHQEVLQRALDEYAEKCWNKSMEREGPRSVIDAWLDELALVNGILAELKDEMEE